MGAVLCDAVSGGFSESWVSEARLAEPPTYVALVAGSPPGV
jgi:hypothetical protein